LDDVVNAFNQPNDLIIDAKAGTGKTTTLKKLANMVPDSSILYLVYNTKN
jgi:superfamily II DNA or RNA helicase